MRKSRSVKKTASARRFSGKSCLAILATAVAALALAIVSLTTGTEVSAQGKAKKFKATRAFVVDKQSGEVRLPTQAEVDEIVQNLTTLGQRPADTLQQSTASNGAVGLDLDGGFGGIVLASPKEDGTFETRCVFTLEEGASFLGLVEDESVQ
jgi:hypothetical protein